MALMGTIDEDTMYQGTNYSDGDIQWRIIHTVYETKDSQDDTNNKGSLDIIFTTARHLLKSGKTKL